MRHFKKLHKEIAVVFKSQPAAANEDVMGFAGTASILAQPHLRFGDLMIATGLKKSTLWAIQDPSSPQFDGSFPASYRLTARTQVWKTAAVLAWIASKEVQRCAAPNAGIAKAKEA